MPDPQQAAAASSSASASPIPVLPTLNPEDSPYKPLNLPQQQPFTPPPAPENKPPADLGAVNHAGAAAYLIDNVLKGASHGAAVGMQYAADQYNKKLSAVQSLYNDQAQQLYTIAKEGRAGTFTGPPGPDGKPTFVPSPEFTATKGRMLAAWQAMMQTVGQRIPQQGGKKGKKQVPAGAQGVAAGGPADQSALLTAALDHKGDPQGSLAAIYQLGVQIGPPIVHQITGFLTPEYISKAQQAAQTEQYTGQGASDKAKMTAEMNAIDADPNATRDQRDRAEQIRMFLNPALGAKTFKRYGKNAETGIEEQYEVDAEGNEIANTRRPLSTTGLNPKVPAIGSFGDFMLAAYGPKPTPKQYVEGQKLWKQSAAQGGTTVSTHTVLVTQGDKQVPFTFTNTSTKSPSGGGGGASAPDVRADQPQSSASAAATTPSTTPPAPTVPTPAAPKHPAHAASSAPRPAVGSYAPVQSGEAIGYKYSQEYKDQRKAADKAGAVATDALAQSNLAQGYLKDFVKDPKNGPAKMGLVATYLRNVIGAHPSSGSGGASVRITNAEWQMAIQSRPWLEGITSRIVGKDFTIISGVTLTRQQALDMAYATTQAAQQAKQSGVSLKTAADEQQKKEDAQVGKKTSSAPASHDEEIMNLLHPKQ